MIPTTANSLTSTSQETGGFDFSQIPGILQGIGQVADYFGGGQGARVGDYYNQIANANELLVDYARRQAEQEYLVDQQNYANRAAAFAANRAAANRAALARAAAARAEEENRLEAARKSLRIQKKARKRAQDLYSPYEQAGHRALAVTEQLFNSGANMLGDLTNLLSGSPSGTELLNKVR